MINYVCYNVLVCNKQLRCKYFIFKSTDVVPICFFATIEYIACLDLPIKIFNYDYIITASKVVMDISGE